MLFLISSLLNLVSKLPFLPVLFRSFLICVFPLTPQKLLHGRLECSNARKKWRNKQPKSSCRKLTDTFIEQLSTMTSEKSNLPYSITTNWIQCHVTFALVRSAVMCLRGCRAKPVSSKQDNILLAAAESQLGC